ncbi:MAG: hypothetical protein R3C09_00795 [Pirellulaceae bacterium]
MCLVATLFFGWLAVYLPQMSPTRVRHRSGLAYNSGRFATAAGVLAAGGLFAYLGGDYARVAPSVHSSTLSGPSPFGGYLRKLTAFVLIRVIREKK